MNPIYHRMACPACESTPSHIVYSNSFSQEPIKDYLTKYYSNNAINFDFLDNVEFIIEECLQCGLIYQRNILNDEYMTKFYDEWMTLPDEVAVRQSAALYKSISREVELIARRFSHSQQFRVLDFGAGWGDWSKMAQAHGAEVSALELSERKTKYLGKNGIRTLSWDDIGHQKFDFINTEQVFEHIAKPYQTLKYFSQSLSKDGVIKISVPNGLRVKKNLKTPDWFAERLGPTSLMPIQPLEHINCYTAHSLESLARRCLLNRIQLKSQTNLKSIIDLSAKDILRPVFRFLSGTTDTVLCHYYQKH